MDEVKADNQSSHAWSEIVDIDKESPDDVSVDDIVNRSKKHVKRTGEIYMMRGLANVFSRGIDKMAHQMRLHGYDAVNFSYTQWRPVAESIVLKSKTGDVSEPVIVVGHSLGANDSSKFANFLVGNDIKVAMIVTFDPVETGHVGPGIGKVVNYYLPKKKKDNRIYPLQGFKGKLENINAAEIAEMTHFNIDKYPPYQQATYDAIATLTKSKSKRSKKHSPRNTRHR